MPAGRLQLQQEGVPFLLTEGKGQPRCPCVFKAGIPRSARHRRARQRCERRSVARLSHSRATQPPAHPARHPTQLSSPIHFWGQSAHPGADTLIPLPELHPGWNSAVGVLPGFPHPEGLEDSSAHVALGAGPVFCAGLTWRSSARWQGSRRRQARRRSPCRCSWTCSQRFF